MFWHVFCIRKPISIMTFLREKFVIYTLKQNSKSIKMLDVEKTEPTLTLHRNIREMSWCWWSELLICVNFNGELINGQPWEIFMSTSSCPTTWATIISSLSMYSKECLHSSNVLVKFFTCDITSIWNLKNKCSHLTVFERLKVTEITTFIPQKSREWERKRKKLPGFIYNLHQ